MSLIQENPSPSGTVHIIVYRCAALIIPALLLLPLVGCPAPPNGSEAIESQTDASEIEEGVQSALQREIELLQEQLEGAETERAVLLEELEIAEAQGRRLESQMGRTKRPAAEHGSRSDNRSQFSPEVTAVMLEQIAVAQAELAAVDSVMGASSGGEDLGDLMQKLLNLAQAELSGESKECPEPGELSDQLDLAQRQLDGARMGLERSSGTPNHEDLLAQLDVAQAELDRLKSERCTDEAG